MKTTILVSVTLLLSSCASPVIKREPPVLVSFSGRMIPAIAMDISTIQTGDTVVWMDGDVLRVSVVGASRGSNVFRLNDQGFRLLTPENYVAKLYR